MPLALVILGVWEAWPALVVPMALSIPLGGVRGFGASAVASGLVMALAAGQEPGNGALLIGAWCCFFAVGLTVGIGFDASTRDIRRATEFSFVDRLTGLHNYAYLVDVLPRECERAARHKHPLSFVLLDFDDFKAFNDQHGHDAGNRLLSLVGQTMRSEGRRSEIAIRYGGEEFAMIILGNAAQAVVAAERIRASVGGLRVAVAGGEWAGTTISAGVAEYDPAVDGETGSRMMSAADGALYASKRAGRDRVTVANEAGARAA